MSLRKQKKQTLLSIVMFQCNACCCISQVIIIVLIFSCNKSSMRKATTILRLEKSHTIKPHSDAVERYFEH